ncbi:hypothetical protein DS2_03640 [Catenovulum agarivorans DS-2]|uniref:Transglutaminase-like domain-containing protein n=1 Tax=Catenovulum agarivorans DS-2 TaxID=1328313 RepID=W7R1T5_9ALTE|nr:hypothetical protein DS2_03640 [Catenovulum agarivorans DS-2]
MLFEKHKLNRQTQFNYVWLNHQQQQHKLSFSLSNKKLFGLFRKFKLYQPHLAQRFVYIQMQKALSQWPNKKQRVKIISRPNDLKIVAYGSTQPPQELINHLLQVQAQAQQTYLARNTYSQMTNTFGSKVVKPDHMRIAKESLEFVSPIVEHIPQEQSGYITRDSINYVLSWIQSIPYSALENRSDSMGLGFNPPNKLLFENQGDCDSKSTLFAAIMRAFVPNLGIVMVYLPNHAMVGLQIPYSQKDEYIEINGNYYVLAEPTGPAILPLAEIGSESKRAIDAGSFTAESMP